MRRLLGLFIGTAILFGSVSSVWAAKGTMNAISFRNIPKNAELQVQPLDNSDSNLALQTEFENALRQRGYKITATAKLILTFETRDEIGAWSTTDRRHVLSFEGKGGRGGGENAKARINIFDSKSGGVLNRGHGGTSIATPSEYRIDVTIEDRTTGKRLWQGWSVAELGNRNGMSLTEKMIPVLADSIGKTIRKQPFDTH